MPRHSQVRQWCINWPENVLWLTVTVSSVTHAFPHYYYYYYSTTTPSLSHLHTTVDMSSEYKPSRPHSHSVHGLTLVHTETRNVAVVHWTELTNPVERERINQQTVAVIYWYTVWLYSETPLNFPYGVQTTKTHISHNRCYKGCNDSSWFWE